MIIAILLALFALLLTMRIRLLFSFKDGKLKLHIKALFLKFELFGDKKEKINKFDFKIKKFRRRRDKALKKYAVKKRPKKEVESKTEKKKKTPTELLSDLKIIFSELVRPFGKYLKIERFNVKISVGGADAAKTALNYGYVIQALQYLVTFLEYATNLDKTKNKSAEVNADFTSGEWNADLNISAHVRVYNIIRLGLKALPILFKRSNKEKK